MDFEDNAREQVIKKLYEIGENYEGMLFELETRYLLKEKDLQIKKISKENGPDITILSSSSDTFAYLECKVPQRGEGDDAVPNPEKYCVSNKNGTLKSAHELSSKVNLDSSDLRITSLLSAHIKQYGKWCKEKIIDKNIPYFLIIHGEHLEYDDDEGFGISRVLYGYGDTSLKVFFSANNDKTPDPEVIINEKSSVKKSNDKDIKIGLFNMEEYNFIYGIFYSVVPPGMEKRIAWEYHENNNKCIEDSPEIVNKLKESFVLKTIVIV